MAVDLAVAIEAQDALDSFVQLGVEFGLVFEQLLGAVQIAGELAHIAGHHSHDPGEYTQPQQVIGLKLTVGDGEECVGVHASIVQGRGFQRKTSREPMRSSGICKNRLLVVDFLVWCAMASHPAPLALAVLEIDAKCVGPAAVTHQEPSEIEGDEEVEGGYGE